MADLNEGWKKENPNSQERRNRDRENKKVMTPGGVGVIKAEFKIPTFSQTAPFSHEVHVEHPDKTVKIYSGRNVKLIKEDTDMSEEVEMNEADENEYVIYHSKTGKVKSVHTSLSDAKNHDRVGHKIGTRLRNSDSSIVHPIEESDGGSVELDEASKTPSRVTKSGKTNLEAHSASYYDKPLAKQDASMAKLYGRKADRHYDKFNELSGAMIGESTVSLIDAISSGDTIAASQHFNDALMSRIGQMIDDRRQEVAGNMFNENLDEANRVRGNINLGGAAHPKNRVPIEHYDEFKKLHPGALVRFRGPRHDEYTTLKSDATHFNVVRTKLKEEVAQGIFEEKTDPYGEGDAAANMGKTYKDNPYPIGSKANKSWHLGHTECAIHGSKI